MAKVYIKFPKTGLGNMLLVWARGLVFAKLNNIEYYTSSWMGLHWGALIRREQKKRLYWGYFIETSYFKQILLLLKYRFGRKFIEPEIKVIDEIQNFDLYVFSKVNSGHDLFEDLRKHQSFIYVELEKILTPRIKVLYNKFQTPIIAIHIRRGDFKLGNTITPNEYFIKGINLIRAVVGNNWPVTIFTDANKDEIKDILILPSVFLAQEKPDIIDILLMSKSKIMLLSQSSTFSYWGAFLSEAIVIRPFNDWQECIKENNKDTGYCEIKWDYKNEDSAKLLTVKIASAKIVSCIEN